MKLLELIKALMMTDECGTTIIPDKMIQVEKECNR